MLQNSGAVDELERHWHSYGSERVVAYSTRLGDLLRSLDDRSLQAPVPGLEWRVIDVVAHLATVWRRYTVNHDRAGSWDAVARANEADLAGIDRDLDALLRDIDNQMSLLATSPALVDPATPLPFHAGQFLRMSGGWGNALAELLVHGDDIARAAGVTWTFDDADLEPFWRYTTAVMPGFMTQHGREQSDRWRLDFGFASGPVRLRFARGAVYVDEPEDAEPDHVVAGRAAEVTLAMPWRRRPSDDLAVTEFCERIVPV